MDRHPEQILERARQAAGRSSRTHDSRGLDDDLAVTARGLCWRKSAGRWQFDADLGNAETAQQLTIRDCRVTGNLTLPIVEELGAALRLPWPGSWEAQGLPERRRITPENKSPQPLDLRYTMRYSFSHGSEAQRGIVGEASSLRSF